MIQPVLKTTILLPIHSRWLRKKINTEKKSNFHFLNECIISCREFVRVDILPTFLILRKTDPNIVMIIIVILTVICHSQTRNKSLSD